MAIAQSFRDYCRSRQLEFDLISHPRTMTAMDSAEVTHLPGDCVAKSVVLRDDKGYVLAVVPATHRVNLRWLDEQLNRHLDLAEEEEIETLFDDCELGAIPPIGVAYGLKTIVDDRLMDQADIYFEGGDHEELVHMRSGQFNALMTGSLHGRISEHV